MKLITRNTDYAVRALCYISKNPDASVSVSELVVELKIPRPFLRKILQTLSGEGLLRSVKGQRGGFSLACSPKKILLTDLIRIFQNTIHLNECIFKKKLCPNRSVCLLKKQIDSIEADVLRRLHKITIASLSGHEKNQFDKRKEMPHVYRSASH